MRILFVDDSQVTRDIFPLVFSRQGFDTFTAKNGVEAVSAVREASVPFDVVVLDLQMPVMNGWEALQAIRELPQGQRLPVIVFTGDWDCEIQTRAAAAGADYLLHKPLLSDELVAIVSQVVEKGQQRSVRDQ